MKRAALFVVNGGSDLHVVIVCAVAYVALLAMSLADWL